MTHAYASCYVKQEGPCDLPHVTCLVPGRDETYASCYVTFRHAQERGMSHEASHMDPPVSSTCAGTCVCWGGVDVYMCVWVSGDLLSYY